MKTNWNEIINHKGYTKPVTRGRIRSDELAELANCKNSGNITLVFDDGTNALIREAGANGTKPLWTLFVNNEPIDSFITKTEAMEYLGI